MATKKVGSAGRFGIRYGKTIRVKIADIEKRQRGRHLCPYCNKQQVRRVSLGVYACRKCHTTFTGRAYTLA